MIKLGRCFSSFSMGDAPYRDAAAKGYSYIEIPLRAMKRCPPKKLEKIRGSAERHGLEVYASNLFFPGGIHLLNGKTSEKKILSYAGDMLAKAKILGIKIAVIGSGGARMKPDSMSGEQASEALADIFSKIAGIAAGYDITIALEPLNRGESNTVNSTLEGYELVTRVDHPNFLLLADYYHIAMENEDLSVLEKAAPVLVHTHIAAATGRSLPTKS